MSKATDSGSSLSFKDLELFRLYADYGCGPSEHREVVLIAPNKEIKQIWEKEYPGIKVILQENHKGYYVPAPKDIK